MTIPSAVEGALNISILGQDIMMGEAWYNATWTGTIFPDLFMRGPLYNFEYPAPRQYNVFKTEAGGFSIIKWFYEKYQGFEHIPHSDTIHYFNADGTEFTPVTEAEREQECLKLALIYRDGRAYFLGSTYGYSYDSFWNDLIAYQRANINYYGIDDTNNFTDLTQDDYNAASLWFFKPVYYEDIADRKDVSNRNDLPRENKFMCVLNGELNARLWIDYGSATADEKKQECDLTRLHMSAWSPNILVNSLPPYYEGPVLDDNETPWGYYCLGLASVSAKMWQDSAILPAVDNSPPVEYTETPPTPPVPPEIIEPVDEDPDKPSGGTGGNNNPSPDKIDHKDDEGRPHIPISDTGVAHLYAPTQAELQKFNDALWDQTTIDYLHGMFTNDPFQAIISLAYYPMDFTSVEYEGVAYNYTDSQKNCVLGKREITENGNKVPMVTLKEDIIVCDFGKCYITPHKNTAMDFAPFTKIQLFLPYIGFVDIDPSDCIVPNSKYNVKESLGYLYVMYKINLYTGDICAYVYGKGVLGYEKLIGQYSGNCCMQLPVTGRDFSSYYGGIAGGLAKTVTDLASGKIGSAIGDVVNTAISASGGPSIQRCGDFSKGAAVFSEHRAFVLRSYPAQNMQNWDNYKELSGLPVNDCNYISVYKSNVNNQRFFQVESVNMKGFNGTDSEAQELEALLKEGVYI